MRFHLILMLGLAGLSACGPGPYDSGYSGGYGSRPPVHSRQPSYDRPPAYNPPPFRYAPQRREQANHPGN